jgi:hypothetical protein
MPKRSSAPVTIARERAIRKPKVVILAEFTTGVPPDLIGVKVEVGA